MLRYKIGPNLNVHGKTQHFGIAALVNPIKLREKAWVTA